MAGRCGTSWCSRAAQSRLGCIFEQRQIAVFSSQHLLLEQLGPAPVQGTAGSILLQHALGHWGAASSLGSPSSLSPAPQITATRDATPLTVGPSSGLFPPREKVISSQGLI